MKTLTVQVHTPEETLYQGKATSLVAPGKEGLFGVLSSHAGMICQLKTGELSIKNQDKEKTFSISKGFLIIEDNKVNILVH